MDNQSESQSFEWFDELPHPPAPLAIRPNASSPRMVAIPPPATAVVALRPIQQHQRVPIWALALSAIAGASAFVLAASLIHLL